MGFKKKPVDAEKVAALALVGCTIECIARHVGVSHDTIQRRFLDVVHKARADAEVQLLGKVFHKALRGQQRSLELCLFNRIGWSEKPTTVINMTQTNQPPDMPLSAAQIRERWAASEQYAREYFEKRRLEGNGQ